MIDRSLLRRFESFSLTGYVPMRDGAPVGHSGCTVCTGVDLGQMSRGDIDALAIADDLKAILRPYCGAKGDDAVRLLESVSLHLTTDEASALDDAVEARHVKALRDRYNAYVVPGLRGWDDLTDAQQTTVASVAWQYGSPWEKCPRFWAACVHQHWNNVIAELRAFGDAFPTRRHAEADYLAASLIT